MEKSKHDHHGKVSFSPLCLAGFQKTHPVSKRKICVASGSMMGSFMSVKENIRRGPNLSMRKSLSQEFNMSGNFFDLDNIDGTDIFSLKIPEHTDSMFNAVVSKKMSFCEKEMIEYSKTKDINTKKGVIFLLQELQLLFFKPANIGVFDDHVINAFFSLAQEVLFHDDISTFYNSYINEGSSIFESKQHSLLIIDCFTKGMSHFYQNISKEFLIRISQLLYSNDLKERMSISMFFVEFVKCSSEYSEFVVSMLLSLVDQYYEAPRNPFPIRPILTFFSSYFVLSPDLVENNFLLFRKSILPIVTCEHLHLYFLPFKSLVEYFSHEISFLHIVVEYLFCHIPRVGSSKQGCYLSLLLSLHKKVNHPSFKVFLPRVLSIMIESFESSNAQVIETIISFFSENMVLIEENIGYIYPALYPLCCSLSSSFWSPQIRTSSDLLKNKLEIIGEKVSNTAIDNNTIRNNQQNYQLWVSIARSAHSFDESFDIFEKFAQIQKAYGSNSNQILPRPKASLIKKPIKKRTMKPSSSFHSLT